LLIKSSNAKSSLADLSAFREPNLYGAAFFFEEVLRFGFFELFFIFGLCNKKRSGKN
jgi:hypothetical protein